MKTFALAAGAVALALTAGSALAAKPGAKGATVMGPPQPIPYAQLDAYLKASPKQRASKDWWSGASTGASADTAATANTSPPSESAPTTQPANPATPPVDNPAPSSTNPDASSTPPTTPPDTTTQPGVTPPNGSSTPR